MSHVTYDRWPWSTIADCGARSRSVLLSARGLPDPPRGHGRRIALETLEPGSPRFTNGVDTGTRWCRAALARVSTDGFCAWRGPRELQRHGAILIRNATFAQGCPGAVGGYWQYRVSRRPTLSRMPFRVRAQVVAFLDAGGLRLEAEVAALGSLRGGIWGWNRSRGRRETGLDIEGEGTGSLFEAPAEVSVLLGLVATED